MDKYMAAWQTVSRQFLAQAQKGMIPAAME
jgi:hypothetical protein